jgi:choline/ethanolamine kinase
MTTAAHSPAAVATLLQELGLLEDGVNAAAAVTVTPISGGNTNRIYRVTCELGEGKGQRDLLLRFFGQGSEAFIDRVQEERIFHAVAAHGLCPKLLASFPEGRVEEFVPAQPLTAPQFRSPALSALVARRLHAFHSISHVDGLPKPSVPPLFAQIRAWAMRAVALCGARYAGWDVGGLVTEVDRLEERLLAVDSPICLCHNDVNHLNVLLRVHEGAADKNEEKSNNGADEEDTEETNVVFVDLEYAGWNYRGFDLGNLLCEWASDFESPHPHVLDFTDHYPTTQEQHHLARAYLGVGEDVREEEVERLEVEMKEFALASHLLWGVWGLLQSKLSTIEFDFVGYARQRLNEYYKGMGGRRGEGGEEEKEEGDGK